MHAACRSKSSTCQGLGVALPPLILIQAVLILLSLGGILWRGNEPDKFNFPSECKLNYDT